MAVTVLLELRFKPDDVAADIRPEGVPVSRPAEHRDGRLWRFHTRREVRRRGHGTAPAALPGLQSRSRTHKRDSQGSRRLIQPADQ